MKRAGKTAVRAARNRDAAVFQRLSQDLEDATVEFGYLVEEEHALMRQRDLAWSWHRAASDQGDVGDRVVGSPERPSGEQAGTGRQDAGYRVNGGAFERLVKR